MNVQLPAIKASVVSICKARDEALSLMGRAAATLAEGQELARQANDKARGATQGARATATPNNTKAADKLDFQIVADESVAAFRKQLDADIWTGLMQTTGMSDMMDHTAKEEFRKSLRDEVPEANEDNITATMANLMGNAELIFQRGLAKAFIRLDKRFKSHDGFKIGARMIMDNLFDQWGSWNGYYGKDEILSDIERVFAVLDGEKPNFNSLRESINASRKGHGARQSETEAAYFKVRGFKNGNAHLWFTRDDLVEKANKLLRAYYGEVLPDAATENEKPIGTAVSTKLQFYGSPPPVVKDLLRDLNIGPNSKVLEPSAGEGAIVRALLEKKAQVMAIEFDPRRAEYCGAVCANFLTYPLAPVFDYVIMNPPFHGTHWMDHVRKAFEALKPGGTLRAVLPASAEVNETAKHEAFRAWVEKVSPRRWGRAWTSLPPESFAASGTNVQTVILEMQK